MVVNLQKNIEVKIGRKILTRGDCEYLSNRISEELGQTLSYNTIRRAFGVESDCKIRPRNSTLNILSEFIGYKSFENFSKESDWNFEWSSQIQISGLVDRMDEKEIIGSLTSAWLKSNNFSVSFVSIIRELFLLGKIQLINKIFKNAAFDFNRLTYSEVIYIGNGVASVLRKMKICNEDLALLLENKCFIQNIFLSFVDYSSLDGYYGNLPMVAIEYKVPLKNDQKLFFNAILNLKYLLSNNLIASNGYQSINKESLHPILIGRLASMEIAARIQRALSYEDVLLDLSQRMQSSKSNKTNYLYELKTVSLILRDFFLMEWICSLDNFSIDEGYQVSHEQYLHIVQLINFVKTKDELAISDATKKVNKMKWVLSYYSFFAVYNIIGMYHISSNSSERKKLLLEYKALISKLKYPIFDEQYLKKYFDT